MGQQAIRWKSRNTLMCTVKIMRGLADISWDGRLEYVCVVRDCESQPVIDVDVASAIEAVFGIG